ncbi:MAG: GSCFA domain-containing protein, partial [Bacteroidota bacterium]|nr:GSCFA domain-containing protein [Bacteroidota bacterium]
FTVSPVRHWKDGAEQNQLSKSTLLLAIHELIDKFENIEYFPSYEIMMDDLRDYRFYTEDMLHPNKVAIDYIWDKFSDRYFDNTTLLLIKEISKIVKAVNHRPYNEESDSHQKFIAKQLSEIDKLKLKNSFLDFTNELEYLGKKLIGK